MNSSSGKKILFVTTSNLSTNPRMLKEITLAVNNRYEVKFIAFNQGNWSDIADIEILKNLKNISYKYIDATRKSIFIWLIVSVTNIMFQKIDKVFSNSLFIKAIASNKRSLQLVFALRKEKENYNYIIGHNMGSLFPVFNFSKKTNIPFGFDVEDYHPGERIYADSEKEKIRREFLLQKILKKAYYVSYASPLIGINALKLVRRNVNKHILINNSFYADEFPSPNALDKVNKIGTIIRFVWFSQNISFGRGLEIFIQVIETIDIPVLLTLIGDCNLSFYKEYIENKSFIKVIQPLQQKDLHLELYNHDIGLSLELNSTDFNRQICWTNKLFAYAQSGLFVLATDTQGQKEFFKTYENVGITCMQSKSDILERIMNISDDIIFIREQKETRHKNAKKLSWENEGNKLLQIWNERAY